MLFVVVVKAGVCGKFCEVNFYSLLLHWYKVIFSHSFHHLPRTMPLYVPHMVHLICAEIIRQCNTQEEKSSDNKVHKAKYSNFVFGCARKANM